MRPPAEFFHLFLRRWFAALQGATRIPMRGALADWAAPSPEIVAESGRHLPGVGLVIGIAACVSFALVSLPLPPGPWTPLLAAVVSTAASVLLTGGRPERALARVVARNADQWAGVLALLLVLAAKLALLAVLAIHSAAGLMAALLAGHAVSRWWPLLLAGPRAVAVAALWCLLPLLLMLLAQGVVFPLLALAASGVAYVSLRRRAREAGGDGAGLLQQACEAAFYLGAAFGLAR